MQIRYWKFQIRGLPRAEKRIHDFLMARADEDATWNAGGATRDEIYYGIKVRAPLE